MSHGISKASNEVIAIEGDIKAMVLLTQLAEEKNGIIDCIM
jgi:hypothetical protein